jgi:hypothetical protein
MPRLAHSLNRSVIVSIPAFFGDDAPRRCTLVDIEPAAGLWFSGDALNHQLGEHEDAAPPDDALATVFFPFNQIVYVFDPVQFAYLARGLGSRAKPTKLAESPNLAAQIHRTGRRHDRPSKKGSKRRR